MLNSSEVDNLIGIVTVNLENTLEDWTTAAKNVPISSDLLFIGLGNSSIDTKNVSILDRNLIF